MEMALILIIGSILLATPAFTFGYEMGERQKSRAMNAAYMHGHEVGLMKGQRMRTLGGRQ